MILIGDYVKSKFDYMAQGIVIAKGFLGKNIPALKIERPDREIMYILIDDADVIYLKGVLDEIERKNIKK